MTLLEVCVVYLLRDHEDGTTEVLMGEKRLGLGAGKVVAPGGKLEPGETPRQAATREVAEEVGLSVEEADLQIIGELTYHFPFRPAWSQRSWAFVATGDWGEPVPSDELRAMWIPLHAVPLHRMGDDAKYWLPGALGGRRVKATFEFGVDLSTVSASDHPRFASPDGG